MGSVRLNKQRRTWFIDYIDATGQRMRQTIGRGEEKKRLARKVLAQREAEAQLGIHRLPVTRTPTFAEWADDWLERMRPPRVKPKTLESYEDAIAHLTDHFKDKRLGGITRKDVETWLSAPHGARPRPKQKKAPAPLSITTVNYHLHVLKFVLNDAVEHGRIAENPASRVKPLKVSEREDALHFLTPQEIAQLLEATENPWRTLYLVAVHTGLRRGELLGLRWRDLDRRKRLLHVRRSLNRIRGDNGYAIVESPLKTRYSRRAVDLSPSVLDALLALPAGDDIDRDYIFRSAAGGPIDPDNVDRAFKRHLVIAELPEIRFHDLRHTHASLLVAAGVHPKGDPSADGACVDHNDAQHLRAPDAFSV